MFDYLFNDMNSVEGYVRNDSAPWWAFALIALIVWAVVSLAKRD